MHVIHSAPAGTQRIVVGKIVFKNCLDFFPYCILVFSQRAVTILQHSERQTHGLNEGATGPGHGNCVSARRGGWWHSRSG